MYCSRPPRCFRVSDFDCYEKNESIKYNRTKPHPDITSYLLLYSTTRRVKLQYATDLELFILDTDRTVPTTWKKTSLLALSTTTLCGVPFHIVALPVKSKHADPLELVIVMTVQGAKGDADQEKAFELELEALNVELANVKIERDKQRQQLEQLTQEQRELQLSRDKGMKRNQLSEQLQDLGISVSQKERSKHRALEDLEQAKSHHRQLKRTLELLEGGVQDIVDRSTNDYSDTSIEGTRRGALRQELLKNILRHNWQNLNAPQLTHHDDEDSEVDDIQEEENDKVVALFGPTAGNTSRLSTASSSTNHSRQASTRTRSTRSSDRSERSPGRNTPRRTRSEQVKSGNSSLESIISHSSEQQRGRKAPMRSQSEQTGTRSLASTSERSRSSSTKSRSSSSRRKSTRSNDRSERSPSRNTPGRTRSEQVKSGSSSLGSIISHRSEQQRGRKAPMRSQSEQSGITPLASVETSERSRSHSRSSSSRQKSARSKSAKRRRGQRKQQQQQQQASPDEDNESRPISPMTPTRPAAGPTSLIKMLERGREDESTGSEGTPKTCNTRD